MKQAAPAHTALDGLLATALAVVVYLSRSLQPSPLYFVDGPRIVIAIQRGVFVVQSPGYWLFAHLGALFANPAAGLLFWNHLFSALGVAVFYLLCRRRGLPLALSLLAALTFASIFFVWFAGEIHSAYASQLLFPVATLYCFARLREHNRIGWLVAAAVCAALGTALRPSDGIFLLPLYALLLFQSVQPTPRERLRACAVFTATFLALTAAWYIPTHHALVGDHRRSGLQQLQYSMAGLSPLLVGITLRSTLNVIRVLLPLLVAFTPLSPALFTRCSHDDNRVLIAWIAPGLLFFALVYMADPTYLTYVAAAFVLAAALAHNRRRATLCLALCLLGNATFFLLARPIPSPRMPAQVFNLLAIKYTRYGISHSWQQTLGEATRPTLPPGAYTDNNSNAKTLTPRTGQVPHPHTWVPHPHTLGAPSSSRSLR